MDRFFFVKKKTAYEMLRSLVGSEMCIRDSLICEHEVEEPLVYGVLVLGVDGDRTAQVDEQLLLSLIHI